MSDPKRMWESEDLPLFSGTPVRVDPPKAASDTDQRQRPLGAECRLCFDTGIVLVDREPKFCWCDAGLQAWDQAQQEGEL